MAFYVGQKVVRVSVSKTGDALAFGITKFSRPEIGEVCTVATINDWPEKTLLTFVEHNNSGLVKEFDLLFEPGFNAKCFRPLVSRKSEISFTQGADPSTDKLDNRRKSRVPA